MSKKEEIKVWVHMDGGLIQWVESTAPIRFFISDNDTEGCDDDELEEITFTDGVAKVYCYEHPAQVSPERVEQKHSDFLSQLQKRANHA